MNSSNAISQSLLEAVGELQRLRPHWRLGQLMGNLAMSAGSGTRPV